LGFALFFAIPATLFFWKEVETHRFIRVQKNQHPNGKKTTAMKTKSISRSAFFNSRLLIGFTLCSVGVLLALG
jgi:hypothetical protein